MHPLLEVWVVIADEVNMLIFPPACRSVAGVATGTDVGT